MSHHRILHYMYSEAIIQSITGEPGLHGVHRLHRVHRLHSLPVSGKQIYRFPQWRMENGENGEDREWKEGDASRSQRLSDPSRWKKQE